MGNIQKKLESFIELQKSKKPFHSEDWTEADTRSKFIDTLLINCLGWSEDDIRREVSADGLRLDYLLSTTRPVLVIEAKKAGIEFPVFQNKKIQTVKLESYQKTNPSLKEHIKQVAQYCWDRSAPIAILTNGKTYILFMAVRADGVPWVEGRLIIIPNIFDESTDFADLYNLLSKDVIISGGLLSRLLVDEIPMRPKNVLSTYNDPNMTIPRNPLGLALEPLLLQVFSDVTKEDSPEVLKNCYVLPGETHLYKEEFEALLLDRPPKFSDAVLSISSKNSYEKFHEYLKDYFSRKEWEQTIFVIGGVGVGKTIFLRRFFDPHINEDEISLRTIAFYIDFRKPGLDPQKVENFIYERLFDAILELDQKPILSEKDHKFDFSSYEGLQQVFWPQIKWFLQGPEGKLRDIDAKEYEKAKINFLSSLRDNKKLFVKGVFRVLREKYHQYACIILDNADQCDAEYQKSIYLYSRTLESYLNCLIVVALREEWYWHFGQVGGPLSAYHDVVYHIPAPRVRNVLERRIDYALELLEKYHIPRAYADLGENFQLEAKHLIKYLRIFKSAFVNNDDVTIFYECLSNGNVRRGLDAFLGFLRSGHTHADEYLKAIVSDGTYVLKFHQVFKSISRERYFYYSSNRSIIPNVFNPLEGIDGLQVSYFVRIYLLNYLARESVTESPQGRGYVPMIQMNYILGKLGLDEVLIKQLIVSFFDKNLIEPDAKLSSDYEKWKYLRITAFGLYIIRNMTHRFPYLEAIMLDTPIKNIEILTRITGLYLEGKKPSLHQRVLCVKDFVKYLQKEESFEQIRVQQTGLLAYFPEYMSILYSHMKDEIDELNEEMKQNPFT